MSESIPIVLIVIAVSLIALIILALIFWRKHQGAESRVLSLMNKKVFFIQWSAGIVLALAAAFFMFDGDILGEDTTGIARIIGIVGLCLIATATVSGKAFKGKSTTE